MKVVVHDVRADHPISGTAQVCTNGACVPAPQCAKDSDCASGFTCSAGQCLCINDAACATNGASPGAPDGGPDYSPDPAGTAPLPPPRQPDYTGDASSLNIGSRAAACPSPFGSALGCSRG